MSVILYRARMKVDDDGLGVFYEEWHMVYETKHFYMCLKGWQMKRYQSMSTEDIKGEYKEHGRKFKKIAKRFSRFAFTEKKTALHNLLIKKNAQINHCRRNLSLVSRFVNEVERNIKVYNVGDTVIKDTKELVNEWYRFD